MSEKKNNNRIKDFGEVFTNPKEVESMLNLVKDETERLDSRFLEPACGDGNFLIKVLGRKLEIVKKKYSNSQIEYERYSFQVISSLYGVEILKDNVLSCRERLYKYFKDIYEKKFLSTSNSKFLSSIKYIISRNILWGDALTLTEPNKKKPIIFSEWSFVKGSLVQRSDYTLADLLSYRPYEEDTLFSEKGEEVIIPPPIKVFEPIIYTEIENV